MAKTYLAMDTQVNERLNVLTQFFNTYYILKRDKYLKYILSSDRTKLRAATFDCEKSNKPYYLSDSLIKKHLRGEELLGIFFANKTTKILGLDLDTHNKRDFARLILLLYSLGIEDHNFLITKSGSKGYHIDILLDCFLYRDKAQKLFDYISSNLGFSYLEARGGISGQGYKLPFSTHFIDCKNIYLCAYNSSLKEVDQSEEVSFIQTKKGLSILELNTIFKKANMDIKVNRNLSKNEIENFKIAKAMKKANEIVNSNKIHKDQKKQTSDIERCRPGNLSYTYRQLSQERILDIEKLISLRGGEIEGMRNNLLFCYAITLKGTFITKETMIKKISSVNNELFTSPLDFNEIQDIVKKAMQNKYKQWKTETIIAWLDINQEEMKYMTTLKNNRSRATKKLEVKKQQRRDKKDLKLDIQLQQIKRLINKGFSNKLIQEELNISKSTLIRRKISLEALYKKGIEDQLLTPQFEPMEKKIQETRNEEYDFYQVPIFYIADGNSRTPGLSRVLFKGNNNYSISINTTYPFPLRIWSI